MRSLAFWKAVTVDRADLLEQVVGFLRDHGIRYCVVGGQAVNAYVEPLVSLDLDLAVVAEELESLESQLRTRFRVERFPHSLNVSQTGSDLRIQIQTDPRYAGFVERASLREVLDLTLPIATLEDVLQGKAWAVTDPGGRASKRQKDLADIARLIEGYPHLRDRVPGEILARLV